MESIAVNQLLILFLQCLIVGSLLLLLFRLRTFFGLCLLFTTLGVFQYMQVFLAESLYIEVIPGIIVTPGSMVLFTGSLFAILLVYIREDALEARKVIYALLAANLVLAVLQSIFSWAIDGENIININNLPKGFFSVNPRILLVGTLVLFIDAFLIIFIYETLARFISLFFLRILISMIVVLSIDSLLFSLGAFLGTEQFGKVLFSGLLSKISSAIIYSIMFYVYLIHLDKGFRKDGKEIKAFEDIFHTLTYRQKFEKVFREKESQQLELRKSEVRFKSLIENAGDAMYLCDFEGNIIEVNNYACDSLGYSRKELLSMKVSDVDHDYVDQDRQITLWNQLKPGMPITLKSTHKRKDGSLFPVEIRIGLIEIKDHKSIIGFARDISERESAELKIKDQAAQWQTTFDAMSDSVCLIDMEGNISQYNKATLSLFNITRKEIRDKRCYQIVHGLTEHCEDCPLIRMKNSKKYESMIIQRNDQWLEVSVDPIFNAKKEITSAVHIVSDITERKQTEELLNKQKSRYYTLLQNLDGLAYRCQNDKDWTMKFVSIGCFKLTGYKAEELIDNSKISFNNLILPEYQDYVWDSWQTKLKNHESVTIEYPIKTASGEIKWVLERGCGIYNKNDEVTHLEGFITDVTKRKYSEIELRKSKETLTQIVYGSSIATIVIDNKHYVTHWNKACEELTGIKAENMLGKKSLWKAFYPSKRYILAEMILEGYSDKEIKSYYNETLKKSSLVKGAYEAEDFFPKLGNTGKWAYFTAAPIKDQNGKIIGAIETLQDITKRKLAQEELIKFADRLQILREMDKSILAAKPPDIIAEDVIKKIPKFINCQIASINKYHVENNSFERLAIFETKKAQGILDKNVLISIYEIIDLELLKKGQFQIIENLNQNKTKHAFIKKIVQKGLDVIILIPMIAENELIGTLNMAAESVETFSPDKIGIAVEIANQLAVSIKQWELREEIIKHTEKLEEKIIERTEQLEYSNRELREFAQIVSHDLKAPLRAISQLSFWLSQDYADKINEEGQDKLKMLIGRVKRLDNLIDGILLYSKAGKEREKEISIDLNAKVEEAIISLNPPSSIKIIIENELPKYNGDPTRLGQLFQNLIDNAIKFMDKPKGLIKIGSRVTEGFYEFYVNDNGPGIEQRYFNRIFQIFQRLESRDNSEGTGVGLSLAKRIVQIYGGEIWLESKQGKGSTFYFTLVRKDDH